jgi:hypothetical protein
MPIGGEGLEDRIQLSRDDRFLREADVRQKLMSAAFRPGPDGIAVSVIVPHHGDGEGNKEDKFNEYESQGINVRLRPRYMRCVVLPRDGG